MHYNVNRYTVHTVELARMTDTHTVLSTEASTNRYTQTGATQTEVYRQAHWWTEREETMPVANWWRKKNQTDGPDETVTHVHYDSVRQSTVTVLRNTAYGRYIENPLNKWPRHWKGDKVRIIGYNSNTTRIPQTRSGHIKSTQMG